MAEDVQKVIVQHTAAGYDPLDAFKVEVERTSTGKYRILCKATQPTSEAAMTEATHMLREMEKRLGITD